MMALDRLDALAVKLAWLWIVEVPTVSGRTFAKIRTHTTASQNNPCCAGAMLGFRDAQVRAMVIDQLGAIKNRPVSPGGFFWFDSLFAAAEAPRPPTRLAWRVVARCG
jgi:hypothetical protein